ncbi:helix-turn-helix domain-containing protein [Saccharomonospora sp. CUA-673]
MYDDGKKPAEIARELRVGRATIYRHLDLGRDTAA